MKNFLITESEKSRILGMHYNAMGKTLVNEQNEIKSLMGTYADAIDKAKPFSILISRGPNPLSSEDIKNGLYDVQFYVTDSQNTQLSKQVHYQCIDSEPNDETKFKAGQIFDASQNVTNTAAELDESGIPWRPMFSVACKPAMAVLAARKAKQPQAQVAGATASKPVTAPNPVSDADVAARQKMSQQTKLNTQQATQQLIAKLSDTNFLNYNKEKTELDKDAMELSTFMATASPTGDDALTLKNRIKVLLKYKPEYGKSPYNLTSNF